MAESFPNRRKHIRVYRNFILTYHHKQASGESYEVSQINNISLGGINFLATHPLSAGAEIGINLQAPFITNSIHLRAVVLDCTEKVSGLIFEVRVRFQGLTDDMIEILEKIERYDHHHEGSL